MEIVNEPASENSLITSTPADILDLTSYWESLAKKIQENTQARKIKIQFGALRMAGVIEEIILHPYIEEVTFAEQDESIDSQQLKLIREVIETKKKLISLYREIDELFNKLETEQTTSSLKKTFEVIYEKISEVYKIINGKIIPYAYDNNERIISSAYNNVLDILRKNNNKKLGALTDLQQFIIDLSKNKRSKYSITTLANISLHQIELTLTNSKNPITDFEYLTLEEIPGNSARIQTAFTIIFQHIKTLTLKINISESFINLLIDAYKAITNKTSKLETIIIDSENDTSDKNNIEKLAAALSNVNITVIYKRCPSSIYNVSSDNFLQITQYKNSLKIQHYAETSQSLNILSNYINRIQNFSELEIYFDDCILTAATLNEIFYELNKKHCEIKLTLHNLFVYKADTVNFQSVFDIEWDCLTALHITNNKKIIYPYESSAYFGCITRAVEFCPNLRAISCIYPLSGNDIDALEVLIRHKAITSIKLWIGDLKKLRSISSNFLEKLADNYTLTSLSFVPNSEDIADLRLTDSEKSSLEYISGEVQQHIQRNEERQQEIAAIIQIINPAYYLLIEVYNTAINFVHSNFIQDVNNYIAVTKLMLVARTEIRNYEVELPHNLSKIPDLNNKENKNTIETLIRKTGEAIYDISYDLVKAIYEKKSSDIIPIESNRKIEDLLIATAKNYISWLCTTANESKDTILINQNYILAITCIRYLKEKDIPTTTVESIYFNSLVNYLNNDKNPSPSTTIWKLNQLTLIEYSFIKYDEKTKEFYRENLLKLFKKLIASQIKICIENKTFLSSKMDTVKYQGKIETETNIASLGKTLNELEDTINPLITKASSEDDKYLFTLVSHINNMLTEKFQALQSVAVTTKLETVSIPSQQPLEIKPQTPQTSDSNFIDISNLSIKQIPEHLTTNPNLQKIKITKECSVPIVLKAIIEHPKIIAVKIIGEETDSNELLALNELLATKIVYIQHKEQALVIINSFNQDKSSLATIIDLLSKEIEAINQLIITKIPSIKMQYNSPLCSIASKLYDITLKQLESSLQDLKLELTGLISIDLTEKSNEEIIKLLAERPDIQHIKIKESSLLTDSWQHIIAHPNLIKLEVVVDENKMEADSDIKTLINSLELKKQLIPHYQVAANILTKFNKLEDPLEPSDIEELQNAISSMEGLINSHMKLNFNEIIRTGYDQYISQKKFRVTLELLAPYYRVFQNVSDQCAITKQPNTFLKYTQLVLAKLPRDLTSNLHELILSDYSPEQLDNAEEVKVIGSAFAIIFQYITTLTLRRITLSSSLITLLINAYQLAGEKNRLKTLVINTCQNVVMDDLVKLVALGKVEVKLISSSPSMQVTWCTDNSFNIENGRRDLNNLENYIDLAINRLKNDDEFKIIFKDSLDLEVLPKIFPFLEKKQRRINLTLTFADYSNYDTYIKQDDFKSWQCLTTINISHCYSEKTLNNLTNAFDFLENIIKNCPNLETMIFSYIPKLYNLSFISQSSEYIEGYFDALAALLSNNTTINSVTFQIDDYLEKQSTELVTAIASFIKSIEEKHIITSLSFFDETFKTRAKDVIADILQTIEEYTGRNKKMIKEHEFAISGDYSTLFELYTKIMKLPDTEIDKSVIADHLASAKTIIERHQRKRNFLGLTNEEISKAAYELARAFNQYKSTSTSIEETSEQIKNNTFHAAMQYIINLSISAAKANDFRIMKEKFLLVPPIIQYLSDKITNITSIKDIYLGHLIECLENTAINSETALWVLDQLTPEMLVSATLSQDSADTRKQQLLESFIAQVKTHITKCKEEDKNETKENKTLLAKILPSFLNSIESSTNLASLQTALTPMFKEMEIYPKSELTKSQQFLFKIITKITNILADNFSNQRTTSKEKATNSSLDTYTKLILQPELQPGSTPQTNSATSPVVTAASEAQTSHVSSPSSSEIEAKELTTKAQEQSVDSMSESLNL